ncbi:MAG TPA: peptidylprolyl isomerase [Gammaproteobacteria bacterium]
MNKTLKALSLLALFALCAPAGAEEEQPQGVLLDRIVAVVNDDVILQSELEAEAQQIAVMLQGRGQSLPPRDAFMRQVLDRMISIELQLQYAERAGIQVSDDRVNQALTEIAARNNAQLSDLPAMLAAEGINYNEFRENVREEMLLADVQRGAVDSRVTVSPREIEEYLARQEEIGAGEQYLVSHILVAVPGQAPPEAIEDARERAENIRTQVMEGDATFAEMAMAYSDGQQALEGGSLGWRELTALPTLFTDVVADLKAGETSQPIRSGSGWHLVRLDEVRGQDRVVATETHARHILLKPNVLRPEEDTLALAREIKARLDAGEDFAALAKEYSEDPVSAAQGGDLGYQPPGTMVAAFEEAISRLEPNEISEPFQTRFGIHIAQVLDRRETDFTDTVKSNRAYQAIKQRKAEEQFPIWLQQLHDEAQIDIRLEG